MTYMCGWAMVFVTKQMEAIWCTHQAYRLTKQCGFWTDSIDTIAAVIIIVILSEWNWVVWIQSLNTDKYTLWNHSLNSLFVFVSLQVFKSLTIHKHINKTHHRIYYYCYCGNCKRKVKVWDNLKLVNSKIKFYRYGIDCIFGWGPTVHTHTHAPMLATVYYIFCLCMHLCCVLQFKQKRNVFLTINCDKKKENQRRRRRRRNKKKGLPK